MKITQKKNLFSDENFDFPFFRLNKQNSIMRSDILEKEDGFKIIVDLPGYKKEDIKIVTENNYLTVYSERMNEEDESYYLHNERYYGKSSRSFFVGEIKKELITASFKNGVLELFIPKESKEEAKTLEIE